ncbi:MAG: tetratricopeptide repeat protein [Flavobacteriia bacterium]|jgi:tetratricopeptide (TPR) repeat protein
MMQIQINRFNSGILKAIFLLILCVSSIEIKAQSSDKYNSKYATFFAAEDLYAKQQYAAARIEFRKFITNFNQQNDPYYVKALYYEGISALELFNNDAIQLLESFNRNYPESIYKHDIYFRIGKYYYQKKDFKTTLFWFNQLTKFHVAPENLDEYNFKLGYSYFELEKFMEARNAFYEVKDGSSNYAPAALYYYSHIAYQDKAYQSALTGFEKLEKNESFKQLSQIYIIQIYYRLGRYNEVITKGPEFMDSTSGAAKLEMTHLIGDAYFELQRYDEAVPYLEKYNIEAKTKREDDYQLAYAYYKSSNYENAIELFDKVSRTKDTLGQISLYHIGESYLKLGNNSYARTAFEAASVIAIDDRIQEDALYNYAILSYKLDINPYDEAIEALELYLEKYPQSDRKKEVYEYLLNVFTQTNNYALALKSLDKIQDKDLKLQGAYQMIAYNQGVSLFQKGEFEKALSAFDLVQKYNVDDTIGADAIYWKAESHYQLKKLDVAINLYKEYISTPGTATTNHRKDAFYNVAYAYIAKQKLNDATEYFRLYLQETNLNDKEQKSDVLLRLGEAYYTTKQNDLAIKYFKECIDFNYSNQDKALYYLSKTYGYKNEADNKVAQLLDIVNNYPKSKYIVLSIYELGLTYRYKNEDGNAQKYFTQLIKDYPKSALVKDAEIEIADIYFKQKKYSQSEEMYRQILSKYTDNQSSCSKAVKGIVEIYKAQRTPDKVEALIKEFPCGDISMDDQEEIYYNSAIEPYLDSAFQESISELEKYLTKFPKGKYEVEIKSYLGNAYYRTKNEAKAIEIYKQILDKPTTDFSELAAVRVSKYLYNSADYAGALPFYLKLEKIASKPDVIYNTQIGIMRCNYLTNQHQEALDYATKVLSYSQINNNIKLEAEFVKGISYYKLDNMPEAQKSLDWVIKNTNSVFAAEAKYTLAEMQYKANDMAKTEKEVRELLKMKPAYDYWVAKALLLQTNVLIAKKDLFQAEYTLKSVIDNYKDEDDGILVDANQLWDELMQLKNKPKNVQDPGTTVIEIKENEKK